MKRIHVFLIIAAVGMAVYANSFQNEFVWDDEYLIANNTHVQAPSVKHALLFFKDNLGKYGQDENNFYRPLQELSYMVDYAIWKLDPVGFHLTNLLLHLSVVFCLFLIVEHISKNQAIALISSLIYLVHPLHVEAVAYIAGRADTLMTLFFLLSLYLYIRWTTMNYGVKKSYIYLSLSSLSFIFALLSKEIAIMLPLVLIFYDSIFKPRGEKRSLLRYAPYLVITASYAILRASVLNFRHPVASIPEGVGFYERLLTSFRVFKEYFRLIILPFDLHMERVLVYSESLLRPDVFLSAILLAIVVMVMFSARRRHKLVFFGMGWFFITIFPLSNIPFALNATMAEHWLYVPLLGIAMAAGYVLVSGVGAAVSEAGLRRVIIPILSIAIIGYFSILTINQNTKWHDSETLYSYTMKYAGDSSRLHYNLGNTYRETGRLVEAEREYKISIGLDPSHSAHFNLGLTYAKMGNADRTISEFQKSIELEPDDYKSYNALGLAYKDKGIFDEAIKHYNKALELSPDYAEAYNNLGDAYFNKEMYKDAEEEFRKALAIDSGYTEAWNNLGVSLIMQGKVEDAITAWNKSLQLNPDQPIIEEYIRRNID